MVAGMTIRPFAFALPLAVLLPLAGCATMTDTTSAQDRFWQALSSHCGHAYSGALVSEDPRDADWQGQAMIAHFAQCEDERIAIAFHVTDPELENAMDEPYWDRSRTWVVTRSVIENAATATTVALTLKHDHRHDDGTPDAVTQYGGTTTTPGTRRAQDFPLDHETAVLFEREGLDASLTNVWRLEVRPRGERDAGLTYQLTRRNDPTRLFRVAFDADDEVAAPPPAWGW